MASRMPAKPKATFEDLVGLPEHLVGEILDGELHASPRPSASHALAASTLQSDLGTTFQRGRGGPGGWWILSEPELHLGEDVAVPDLAGWRRDRLPSVPDAPFLTLAPDWVCEVVSPSTERIDRVKKLPLYAREGVRCAWLVNPKTRTLEVFRNEGTRWVLLASHADDAQVRAEPFDAVELDLLALWGDDRP
jgi:Uma2 family endonuclease